MRLNFENKYHKIEKNHFWFRARRSYIIQLLSKESRDSNVLDIGCSSGILLEELKNIGFKQDNLYGIDISESAINKSVKNGIKHSYVMDAINIHLDKKFDMLIASDSLEHILNDTEALKNWHQLLNPSGRLYIFVPAFMFLWSSHDVNNMHYNRYTQKELKAKLIKNGYEIEKSGYWNFFLFIPILCIRLKERIGLFSNQNSQSDIDKIPIFNNVLFKIMNIENRLLKYLNFPFGVSTFCIAKKKTKQLLKNHP